MGEGKAYQRKNYFTYRPSKKTKNTKVSVHFHNTRFQKAIEKSKEWVVIAEESGKIIYVNDFVLEVSGYKEEEIIGKTPRVFKSGYYSEDFYNSLWRTLLDKKEFNAILVNRKKNGETFYLEEKNSPYE